MTIYPTIEEILAMHDDQIARFGGASGVRDMGLIEAALLRPQMGYYGSILEEAAALWESLAMNHGFVDGNKRIALNATLVFLDANGFEVTAEPDDLIHFIYTALEGGIFTKDVLHDWLKANTGPFESG